MTVRRLLVLGVCALGVGSLYLVPGIARSPQQAAQPRRYDGPTARASATVVQDASATPSGERSRTRPSPDPAESTDPSEPEAAETATAPSTEPVRTRQPREPRPTRTGATAFDPAEPRDDEAPEPVAAITSADVSPTALTLRWPAAADNVGVVQYTVVLNGYPVATTPTTSATVRWFNDDTRQQVVQVLAVDAAGNESPSSPNLLVARPTPGPTPSPSEPAPSPSEPTDSGPPTPQPTPHPSEPVPAPEADDETSAGDADQQVTPDDDEEN